MAKQAPIAKPRRARDLREVRKLGEAFERVDGDSTSDISIEQSSAQAVDDTSALSLDQASDKPLEHSRGHTLVRRRGRLTKKGRTGGRGVLRRVGVEMPPALWSRLEAEKLRRGREGVTLGDIVAEMMRATGRAPKPKAGGEGST